MKLNELTKKDMQEIKENVISFLDSAKEMVEDDFYIPDDPKDNEDVLSMMAGDLLYVTALRYALYHDCNKLKEMIKINNEGDIDSLFDLAIMLEDKYGATGSNREREIRELVEKISKLLSYNIPNEKGVN